VVGIAVGLDVLGELFGLAVVGLAVRLDVVGALVTRTPLSPTKFMSNNGTFVASPILHILRVLPW
jgi:hypothetical protein